jgi:hypothetical protein
MFTDEEKVQLLALMLGDVPGSAFHPLFTEEQYKQFLKLTKGNVNQAAVYAAISAAGQFAGESSREVIGELSISNSTATNFFKLLDYIQKTNGKVPPDSLMPWFAGSDKPDDNKLLAYERCDPCGLFVRFRGGC